MKLKEKIHIALKVLTLIGAIVSWIIGWYGLATFFTVLVAFDVYNFIKDYRKAKEEKWKKKEDV